MMKAVAIAVGLAATICVVSAAALAFAGKGGSGWFLIAAVAMVVATVENWPKEPR
ncbi:hypothetical protein [Sinorhizobium fredii]|uniref:hypothetical protein n=1 Tax=Rhizobium fredii TaxID=380 RepID=UPI0004B1DD2D|nr:hypothetical protein [Sinorhizobium fredii]ASY68860.1 hypothetical protein SF83666_c14390 [Sinorhizobium fredii CCBAU 83666]